MATDTPREKQDDEFSITFRSDALAQLRAVAKTVDQSDNLVAVLQKGIKLLELAKGDKVTIEQKGETLIVDLKKL
jgi:arginine/ornithine N-succinyltransferase beta subunit